MSGLTLFTLESNPLSVDLAAACASGLPSIMRHLSLSLPLAGARASVSGEMIGREMAITLTIMQCTITHKDRTRVGPDMYLDMYQGPG